MIKGYLIWGFNILFFKLSRDIILNEKFYLNKNSSYLIQFSVNY